jgi:hypothetical protein
MMALIPFSTARAIHTTERQRVYLEVRRYNQQHANYLEQLAVYNRKVQVWNFRRSA